MNLFIPLFYHQTPFFLRKWFLDFTPPVPEYKDKYQFLQLGGFAGSGARIFPLFCCHPRIRKPGILTKSL